jgi:hypothetical protein
MAGNGDFPYRLHRIEFGVDAVRGTILGEPAEWSAELSVVAEGATPLALGTPRWIPNCGESQSKCTVAEVLTPRFVFPRLFYSHLNYSPKRACVFAQIN